MTPGKIGRHMEETVLRVLRACWSKHFILWRSSAGTKPAKSDSITAHSIFPFLGRKIVIHILNSSRFDDLNPCLEK